VRARLHYIDWLRVLAVLLLFPFHVSRVFDAGDPFYVKSAHLSMPLTYVLGFISVWHMPLLFVLAGASTYFALSRRTGRQYAAERVKRLLVPFVFGIFVLIPPQTWYGARFNSGYTASFARYMLSGSFLVWNIHDGGDYYGGLGIGQLWFILWLFAISLAALPLVLRARTGIALERMTRFSALLAKPLGWLLAAVLLFAADAMPDPVGKNIFWFFVLFVLGYAAVSTSGFMEAAERHRFVTLPAGLALSLWWALTWQWRNALADPSVVRAVVTLCGMLATWLTVLGLLGWGRALLDRPSAVLSYLGEASYPLYILHQTVIVVAAFYLVKLPVGGVAQWVALLIVAIAGTFALYEAARRVNPLRALLGMK
jgi:peptidoglycan/LPS O-acetylase OafA/YrhL